MSDNFSQEFCYSQDYIDNESCEQQEDISEDQGSNTSPDVITVTVSPMEDPSEEYVNLAEETGLQIFQGQIEGHRQVLATHKCMAGATFSPTKTLDFHRPSCATRADPVKDPASPNRNL
ncbi:hypothetical protein DdX_19441 [Ditylenchus destructor]|uniref:Uncharacterized protein n=1 Tax=Ditylenchus destructor TaxID=166010 RepID=A0AAD4MMM0_9BILA|nr:hypothetical protein DdX_19441 [Ditylenchus destructor]